MEKVMEVWPRVRMIRPTPAPDSAWEVPNIYLIGEGAVTLVDCGYAEGDSVPRVIEALGSDRISQIILTHGHRDHAGGAKALKQTFGCRVMIYGQDLPAMTHRHLDVEIDALLEEGDAIEAGPRRLTVLATPGHSPGHISLWEKDEGLLFTGDLVTGAGSTVVAPPEGDMLRYMQSLIKVRNLPGLEVLFPGHGPLRRDPYQRIAELVEHRELREICIAKCLEKRGMDITQLIGAMYLGLIHPGLHLAAAATIIAHLQKLIAEKKVDSEPKNIPLERRTFFLTVDTPLPF